MGGSNKDFDIPNGSSFEEMKQAVENLSIEDITRKVVEQADKLVDDEFTDEELEAFHQLLNQYATASRHASKRTADLDLDWWQTSAGMWAADLPEIPGFPCAPGRYWHVSITSMYSDDTDEFLGYGFNIGILDAHGGVTLFENEFGFPYVDTQEEAMQEVESLSPEMIAQAAEDAGLEPVDNVSASRKGHKMIRKAMKRTASMDLEWTNTSEDTWQADLPAIPGYTGADGNDSFVTVVYNGETELAVPYDAVATIFLSQGGVVNLNLWDMWSFDPFGPDAKDVMQAVDDLDVYDISHQLEQLGYEPIVNEDGEYVVASRKAHFDLEWEKEEDGSYFAPLPYSYDAYVYDAATVRGSSQTGWRFQITDGYYILDDTDFGIPAASTAEEAMGEVEDLTFEDIDKKMAELFPEQ